MNQNAKLIYNLLLAAGVTRAGALGLLGNWMAESGLEPGRLQGDFSSGRLQSMVYTADVTSGKINRSQFARDAKGYGLAQWTYYTRKEDLYDFWQSSGTALDDVGMQVKFALQELCSEAEYSGVWATLRTTDDIWTAVDKVCRLYERPYYNNIDARYRYAKELEAELEQVGTTADQKIPEEPSEAGLSGKGGAAEGASFPDAKGNSGSALPGAGSADTEFPQRSKNRRISVSPNDSSGTARWERDDPELATTQLATTFWPPRTICNGMSGDDTAVLQAVLAARGYPVHYVDGAFGAYLEDIVKDFQMTAFPDEPAEWDGIVGPKTWGELLRQS